MNIQTGISSLILLCSVHVITALPNRANILLITSEDHGPELACYGDPYAQTPRLDRLAREGIRFANAFIRALFAMR